MGNIISLSSISKGVLIMDDKELVEFNRLDKEADGLSAKRH